MSDDTTKADWTGMNLTAGFAPDYRRSCAPAIHAATPASPRIAAAIAGRRPGWGLERAFYTDEDFFAHDLARVFMRYWLFAGATAQITKPGDYFLYEIGHESLVIVRAKDGGVRALFNVCQHRGSRICTAPEGRAPALVCPYHQWTYDTEGRLTGARFMPKDFDKSQFPLEQAHVRVLDGLIFVSLAHDPPPFDQAAKDMGAYIEPHGLERAKICQRKRYDLACNWKLVIENSRECYHCKVKHPEYCSVMYGATLDSADSDWAGTLARHSVQWKRLGLETEAAHFTPTTWHHTGRLPFRDGALSQSLDGKPVAPLMGSFTEHATGASAVVAYPNFWLEASSDHAVTIRLTPMGARSTRMDVAWYVDENAVEGVDYDLARVTGIWEATGAQDWKLCQDNQAGVDSTHYRPGPYFPTEGELDGFVQWYLKQIC
jgi:glycine betaine catabolism A